MNNYIYIILAVLSGTGLAVQIGLNTTLAKVTSPLWTGFVVFATGALVMGMALIFTRSSIPDPNIVRQAPSYVWLTGLCGSLYVFTSIIASPRIGAGTLVIVVTVSKIIVSLYLDHCGFEGLPIHTLNAPRIMGMLLLIAGMLVVNKF